MCLDPWSPAGGTVWGGLQPLGAGASLEAGWLVFSILSHRIVTALNLLNALCPLLIPSNCSLALSPLSCLPQNVSSLESCTVGAFPIGFLHSVIQVRVQRGVPRLDSSLRFSTDLIAWIDHSSHIRLPPKGHLPSFEVATKAAINTSAFCLQLLWLNTKRLRC